MPKHLRNSFSHVVFLLLFLTASSACFGEDDIVASAHGEFEHWPFGPEDTMRIGEFCEFDAFPDHTSGRGHLYTLKLACVEGLEARWLLPISQSRMDEFPIEERLEFYPGYGTLMVKSEIPYDKPYKEMTEEFWAHCLGRQEINSSYLTRHEVTESQVIDSERSAFHGTIDFDLPCYRGTFEFKINTK